MRRNRTRANFIDHVDTALDAATIAAQPPTPIPPIDRSTPGETIRYGEPQEPPIKRIDRRPDWQPCNARPGSEAKLAELERRYAVGLPLWHPRDRTQGFTEQENQQFNFL